MDKKTSFYALILAVGFTIAMVITFVSPVPQKFIDHKNQFVELTEKKVYELGDYFQFSRHGALIFVTNAGRRQVVFAPWYNRCKDLPSLLGYKGGLPTLSSIEVCNIEWQFFYRVPNSVPLPP